MKVYIDLVLLLNFFIDLILLISVNYILRRNSRWVRLFLGALFGSITLFIFLLKMNYIFNLIFKLIISFFIILIAFGYKDMKCFFKNVTYFYLVSMLLGGGIEFLSNQFKYTTNGIVSTNEGIKVSYSIVFILGIFLFFKYINCFKYLKNNYSNYFKCKIYFDDKQSIVLNGFLDTGNKLVDPYSRKSIVLVDKDMIRDIKVRSPVYVPYNSLNNHGLLTCYKALRLEIDGMSYDKFLIGISNEHFYMDGIECILNTTIMEGLK